MGVEIQWPVSPAWEAVPRRAAKAEKAALPEVAVAVGKNGGVTLTLSPETVKVLRWSVGIPLTLEAQTEGNTVFLRLESRHGATYALQGSPKPRGDGLPSRSMVRLFKCGGRIAGPRKSAGVAFRHEHGVLFVAVPATVVAGAEAAATDAKFVTPSPADLRIFVDFALAEVLKVWPGRVDRGDRNVRVTAAVALVEFGLDRDAVRDALNLTTILPEREDMPMPARKAATAALEALRTATGKSDNG